MDTLEKTIKKLYDKKPLSIQYLDQGLTNNNYLLVFKDKKHVLRLPKLENATLFDYPLEKIILEKVKSLNLDVPLLYYNAENGIKITEFIEGADHYERQYLVEATHLIKRLHMSKLSAEKEYDIVKMFNKYKQYDEEPLFDTSFAYHYLHDAKELSKDIQVLCHNDLVEGNFLFTKNRSYLIDYEYAMDNHPYFDIMSFITENDIQSLEDRELIYKTYFEREISDQIRAELKIFEIAHHVLWGEWASFMFHQYNEKIYYDIAKLKYKRLLEALDAKEKPETI